jgi:hypothetical protein
MISSSSIDQDNNNNNNSTVLDNNYNDNNLIYHKHKEQSSSSSAADDIPVEKPELDLSRVSISKLIRAEELSETDENSKRFWCWKLLSASSSEQYPSDFIVHSANQKKSKIWDYRLSEPVICAIVGILSAIFHLASVAVNLAVVCGVEELYHISIIASVINWIFLPKWYGIWTSLISNKFEFKSWNLFVSKDEQVENVEMQFVSRVSEQFIDNLEQAEAIYADIVRGDQNEAILKSDLAHIWQCLIIGTLEMAVIVGTFAALNWNFVTNASFEMAYSNPSFVSVMISISFYVMFSLIVFIAACAGNIKHSFDIKTAYRNGLKLFRFA